jgi:transposase
LWVEYKEQHPDGYQYTQFCEHYWRWRKKLDYCMRQEHRGGEKLFIDYSDGLSIVDRVTGELTLTQLFLAVWGASNYTYAEATLSQTLPDWIGAHRRALEYFRCSPRVLVPDNLKSGVSKACKYEPDLNPTYSDMAEHYGCAVLPARPRKPRDKATVENGVLIAKRWILAVLRHRTFYSLADLNAAIRECLERLNNRPLKKLKRSRRELFEAIDRPNALPLPLKPYEYAEWYKARVQLNYHVEVDEHYYSVPCRLIHERLDVRLTATSAKESGRPPMPARTFRAGTPRKRSTCRWSTAATPSGAPSDSSGGRARPARRPPGWWKRYWPRALTRSRATRRAWVLSTWCGTTSRRAWRRRPSGPSNIRPAPTAR